MKKVIELFTNPCDFVLEGKPINLKRLYFNDLDQTLCLNVSVKITFGKIKIPVLQFKFLTSPSASKEQIVSDFFYQFEYYSLFYYEAVTEVIGEESYGLDRLHDFFSKELCVPNYKSSMGEYAFSFIKEFGYAKHLDYALSLRKKDYELYEIITLSGIRWCDKGELEVEFLSIFENVVIKLNGELIQNITK